MYEDQLSDKRKISSIVFTDKDTVDFITESILVITQDDVDNETIHESCIGYNHDLIILPNKYSWMNLSEINQESSYLANILLTQGLSIRTNLKLIFV